MATLATDNFNRTDEGNITDSGNWAEITGEEGGTIALVSNVAVPNFTGADSGDRWVGTVSGGGTTWTDDQYSQAKLTVNSTTAGSGPCVIVRSAAAAQTYYRAVFDHAVSNNVTLTKVVAGSFTTIWQRTATFSDGDTCRLEAQGTTLRVLIGGVQVGADSTDAAIAAGNPGIGLSTDVTSASIEDWEGGSIAAGAGRTTRNTRAFPLGVSLGMSSGMNP